MTLLSPFYPVFLEFNKKARIFSYRVNGKKPWSKGYSDYKWKLIKKVVNNKQFLNKITNGKNLPHKYGLRIDERVIEYPWLIANLPADKGKLLDAGSTLNYEIILENTKLKDKKISIVNLIHDSKCFWQKGISYFSADIRKLPFPNNSFNIITCISALEHVGMDNTMIYTKDRKYKEKRVNDYLKVIQEFNRILKPKGQLLITVPFGKYQNLQFMQQFDIKMVKQVIKSFASRKVSEISYYKYCLEGWNISTFDECKNEKYFNIHQSKTFDFDFAAAARSVACIKLIKE